MTDQFTGPGPAKLKLLMEDGYRAVGLMLEREGRYCAISHGGLVLWPRTQDQANQEGRDAELGKRIRLLVDGGPFDLTDSPQSFIETVKRLAEETAGHAGIQANEVNSDTLSMRALNAGYAELARQGIEIESVELKPVWEAINRAVKEGV